VYTLQRHTRRPTWSFRGLDRLQRQTNQVLRASDATPDSRRGVYPPVNLHESEEGFSLTAEIPGVTSEALEVSIEGTTVTLAGSRKPQHVATDETAVHRRERLNGTFRRAFQLPAEIDLDKARATHRNGVLTLDLPKSPALRPRQIPVETP